MSSLKSDFFVRFRVFYIKELTRQKKVTNKLFKSVRCVVIAREPEASGRRDGIRLVVWRCGGLCI